MEPKVIYLSPSTQENNLGIDDYGTEEYRMNRIADIVERLLNETGRYIVYRNNPNDSLSSVVAESNRLRPDIHVAIHSNAGDGSARGPEIFANRQGTSGDKLANAIYNEILKIYPEPQLARGVKYTDVLYEIINTLAPSTLLEIAFHDNKEDANWIMQNEEEIARAIVNGINEYFA